MLLSSPAPGGVRALDFGLSDVCSGVSICQELLRADYVADTGLSTVDETLISSLQNPY